MLPKYKILPAIGLEPIDQKTVTDFKSVVYTIPPGGLFPQKISSSRKKTTFTSRKQHLFEGEQHLLQGNKILSRK
jgi:hypothetical protein